MYKIEKANLNELFRAIANTQDLYVPVKISNQANFTAGLKMLKQMKKTVFNMIIISITLICMVVFSLFAVKFSTIFYILISGICGVVVYLIGKFGKEKKHDLS